MVPKRRILGLFCLFVLFAFVGKDVCEGGDFINLSVGESTVRSCSTDTWLVSIGKPGIADVQLKKAGQKTYVLIVGKAEGSTNIVICTGNNCTNAFKLKVWDCIDPCNTIKQKLKEVLPGENINVIGAGDTIILSGEVSSTTNISIAMNLAEAFVAGRESHRGTTSEGVALARERWEKEQLSSVNEIINLMQVGGVQQVMLEVRVAEMGRKLARKMGINWSVFGSDFNISYLNDLTTGNNILFNYFGGSTSWTGLVDALKTEGIMRILAKPTLITLSGQEAKFLAGGQFPVPVASNWGEVAIEWKDYGVELRFTPTVLSDDKISLTVLPGVSELDYDNAVEFWGFVIPAITQRYASTTIELDDGQSFAIAGLLKDEVRETVQRFPFLGDIPILGAIFRSSEYKRHETELVIIVTPHLVKPLDMAKQTLPTDAYVDPDDFEFYLMGQLGGAPKEEKVPPTLCTDGGFEGDFGHIAP